MIYYVACESYHDYWDGDDQTYVASAATLPESTCKKWTRRQRYMGAEMDFPYSQTNIYYEITKEEHDAATKAWGAIPKILWGEATNEEVSAYDKAYEDEQEVVGDLYSKYAEISLRSKI